MSKKTQTDENTGSLLGFIGSAGVAGICLGVGGPLFSGHFWWLVYSVYGGSALLAIDLFFNRKWRWNARFVVGLALLLGIFWFSRQIVLHPNPIRIEVVSTPHTLAQPDGSVEGIKWKPEYYETRINFFNDTDDDYSDVNISINIDRPIAELVQVTKHGGVEFPPEVVTMGVPTDVVSVDRSVHIDRLRRHDTLMLLAATVTVDQKNQSLWLPKKRPNIVTTHMTYQAAYGRDRDDTVVTPVRDIP